MFPSEMKISTQTNHPTKNPPLRETSFLYQSFEVCRWPEASRLRGLTPSRLLSALTQGALKWGRVTALKLGGVFTWGTRYTARAELPSPPTADLAFSPHIKQLTAALSFVWKRRSCSRFVLMRGHDGPQVDRLLCGKPAANDPITAPCDGLNTHKISWPYQPFA